MATSSQPHDGFGCRLSGFSETVRGSHWKSTCTSQRPFSFGPLRTRPSHPLYIAAPTRPCRSTRAPGASSNGPPFFGVGKTRCPATLTVESHNPEVLLRGFRGCEGDCEPLSLPLSLSFCLERLPRERLRDCGLPVAATLSYSLPAAAFRLSRRVGAKRTPLPAILRPS